jgi:hypothetical protein
LGAFTLSQVKQKEADAGIEMAVKAGLNHIDFSPLYGQVEAWSGSWFGRHGNSFSWAGKKSFIQALKSFILQIDIGLALCIQLFKLLFINR